MKTSNRSDFHRGRIHSYLLSITFLPQRPDIPSPTQLISAPFFPLGEIFFLLVAVRERISRKSLVSEKLKWLMTSSRSSVYGMIKAQTVEKLSTLARIAHSRIQLGCGWLSEWTSEWRLEWGGKSHHVTHCMYPSRTDTERLLVFPEPLGLHRKSGWFRSYFVSGPKVFLVGHWGTCRCLIIWRGGGLREVEEIIEQNYTAISTGLKGFITAGDRGRVGSRKVFSPGGNVIFGPGRIKVSSRYWRPITPSRCAPVCYTNCQVTRKHRG